MRRAESPPRPLAFSSTHPTPPPATLTPRHAGPPDRYEEEAAAYAEVDMTGDGELDEEELRQFLLSKKKEGRLRKDVDTKVGTIMEKYDMGNKGFLDLAEFEKMQAEVLSEAPVDVGAEVVNIKAQLKAMVAKLDALTALLSKG